MILTSPSVDTLTRGVSGWTEISSISWLEFVALLSDESARPQAEFAQNAFYLRPGCFRMDGNTIEDPARPFGFFRRMLC